MITKLQTLPVIVAPIMRAAGFWLLFFLFVVGGGVAGLLGLVRLISNNPAVATIAMDLPVIGAIGSLPDATENGPDWRNLGRVTVLIMGIDRREDEFEGSPVRTDTMMLATIDPGAQTAGMLGIPRDLLVPIAIPTKDCSYLPWGNPYAQDRVNTAFVYGQLCSYKGAGGEGGPGLAKDTVQYNFGIRVHYYAMLDFDGFSKLIDAIGGVEVDVPATLIDNQYPTRDYGFQRIRIEKGLQRFDGETALRYVRSRHMDSDFGRIQRQQLVLLAVRDRLLRLDMVPKIPQLLQLLSETIQTDMGPRELLALAAAVREVPRDGITSASLEFPLVSEMTGYDGASLLLPNRNEIRELITQMFGDTRLQAEAPRVEVLNGTGVAGLAKVTADRLKDRGFVEVSTGNTDDGQTRGRTEVLNLTGKTYSASVAASALGLSADRIKAAPAVSSGTDLGADIRIILGDDLRPR